VCAGPHASASWLFRACDHASHAHRRLARPGAWPAGCMPAVSSAPVGRERGAER
jgi:hypothetical protein